MIPRRLYDGRYAVLATRLTEMLKVKHPIMLAGMAGVSYAELTAAMSEAGGYGVLARATCRSRKCRPRWSRCDS